MANVVLAMRCWLVLMILLVARGAAGSASPVFERRDPPPLVRVLGSAELCDARVTVDCISRRILERSARCEVRATFTIAATGAVTLTPEAYLGERDRVELGGAGPTLAAGQVATVTITARRALSTSWRLRDPYIIPAMVVRHMFLGESTSRQRRAGEDVVVLAGGPELVLGGEPALEADGDGRVRIALGRDEVVVDERGRPRSTSGRVASADEGRTRERRLLVSLTVPPIADAHGWLHQGGPLLAAGVRQDRFVLRGAWEVGLGERLFLTASVETDFDSVLESLVLDVATPQPLIIPSVRAGVGVVARQLGPRDADVGVRLRAGASLFAMGGDVDFDYWPAIDEWTLTAAARLSL